jgi:hypothetical protein
MSLSPTSIEKYYKATVLDPADTTSSSLVCYYLFRISVFIPFVMLSVYEIVDVLYLGKGLPVHILTAGRALRQLTFSHWPMKAR